MIDILGVVGFFGTSIITVITTSDVFPIARGEIIPAQSSATLLALRLVEPFDCFGPGATVFFSGSQIVALG